MGPRARILWLLLLASCTKSNSIECGTVICSELSVCNPAGTGCVLQTQVDACQGKADEDACTFPGASTAVCVTGVCTELGCGNNHIDPQLGEICDDGNRLSGDGCSADCKSKEMCGDGVTDFSRGEECDAGDANSNDPGAPCRPNCKPRRCGDGVHDPNEFCDDGNIDPGDGCRADCSGRWTVMQSNTLVGLNDVWAIDATHAWAVGNNDHVMRWDGATWSRLPPINIPGLSQIRRVWASSENDVWVITDYSDPVFRYNGSQWQGVNVGSQQVLAVHGRGPDDIWFAGGGPSSSFLTHYFGGAGHTTTAPLAPTTYIQSVFELPGGLVYVADGSRNFFKYSGTWSQELFANADIVTGTSTSDVSAFCDLSGNRAGKHFNGSTWTSLTNATELTAFTATSASSIETLVVGGNGGAMICTTTSCTISQTPTTFSLLGVSTYAPKRAFIVGSNGTILY